jgi:hypothetical protein
MNAESPKVTTNNVIVQQARYAIVMLITSLLVGLVYREFSRPFFEGLNLEEQWRYGHPMSMAHGHTFFLGAAIPVILIVLTHLYRSSLGKDRITRLQRLFIAYRIAATTSVILIIYQGLSFIVGAGRTLDEINAGLFLGSVALRSSLYAIAHITLAVAVIWYGIIIYKAINTGHRQR